MRSILAATLLASGASLLPFGAYQIASAQSIDAFQGTIRAIEVEGNQRIEPGTVQSYLQVKPGDQFNPNLVDLSLKALFATQLFSDVSIDRRGDVLIVQVVENPIINRVIFEGNKALKEDKLREEIQAEPRSLFTRARVQADVQRVLDLYQKSGRFSARVEPTFKPLEQNRVDLVFEITEGPVTGIRGVNFIGNTAFDDRRLRGQILTTPTRFWKFFTSHDNYDPGRLQFDEQQLREFYRDKGYFDFGVVSAVAEMTPDREDFYITITVDEGEVFNFGDVKVETALDKLNADALQRLVRIKSGEVFQASAIEDVVESLTYAAGIAGYAFVDIRPNIQKNEATGKIDVTFDIDEGQRAYIGRIDIVGNTRTLDRVIRRELVIAEGDAFNRILIDRSKRNVRSLGFFKDVSIEELPSQAEDRTNIKVEVEEQPTGEVSASAGYSSANSYSLNFGLSERNLGGRGQRLSAQLGLNQYQQSLNVSFTEPRFLDRTLSAGLNAFVNKSDFSDYGSPFTFESFGAGTTATFPLSQDLSFNLRYRLQYDDINVTDFDIAIDSASGERATQTVQTAGADTPDDASDDVFGDIFALPTTDPFPVGAIVVDQCDPLYVSRLSYCRSEQEGISSILGYSLAWDKLDDRWNPRNGFNLSISQDFAGLGGDVKYTKSVVNASFYKSIWRDVVASATLQGGAIIPFEEEDGVRISDRFYRGGNNFRGFRTQGLGPREIVEVLDATSSEVLDTRLFSSLGGTQYYQGTFELSLPQILPEQYGIKTALFLEAGSVGNLYDIDKEIDRSFTDTLTGLPAIQRTADELSLRASAGLSVFWDSPFGPIRLDFSQILQKEEYDRTETFNLTSTARF